MTNINTELAKIRKRSEKADVAKVEKAQALHRLETRIKAGESTGDKILDIIIVFGAEPGGEEEQTLRGLEQKMKGMVGQLFLLILREREQTVLRDFGHDIDPKPSDFSTRERYTFGILNGEELVIDPKEKLIAIPAEAYLDQRGNVCNGNVDPNNLFSAMSSHYYLFRLGEFLRVDPLGLTNGYVTDVEGKPLSLIEMHIGDTNVVEYSSDCLSSLVGLYDSAKKLGKDLIADNLDFRTLLRRYVKDAKKGGYNPTAEEFDQLLGNV